jgi:hypothetical protein
LAGIDGQIACLIFDADDEVYAWYRLTTGRGSDKYENVAVLPGCLEDSVYTVANRRNKRFSRSLRRRNLPALTERRIRQRLS